MAHDSVEVDGKETGLLRNGARNRDEKLQPQSRKPERTTEARKKAPAVAQPSNTLLMVKVGAWKFRSKPT
jgi:hypothetical protein